MRLGKRRDLLAPHGEVGGAQSFGQAPYRCRTSLGLMLTEPAIDKVCGGQRFGHKILGEYF